MKKGENTLRTPVEEREVAAGNYTYNLDGSKNGKMEVYTSDYGYMLKFDKFCKEQPEHWKLMQTMKHGGDIVGKRYLCSWECLLFRAKPRTGTPQTEEQKKASRERMLVMHKAGALASSYHLSIESEV